MFNFLLILSMRILLNLKHKKDKKYFWLLGVILLLQATVGVFFLTTANEKVMADEKANVEINQPLKKPSQIEIIEGTTLLAKRIPPQLKVVKRFNVIVTAYSSSIWETQGDPFITASGKRVRDGIVANNLLPFGTKIRLPKIFGDKIFEVQDRMNPKKGYYHVDVWFPSREEALNFGWEITTMEILE